VDHQGSEKTKVLPLSPETGRIEVPPELARELLKAAESLPLYDNKEFYSPGLQLHILMQVRAAGPDRFDRLVDLIKDRLTKRPYCALVAGLDFDEGNRLFVALNRAFGELVARPYEKPRAQLVHYIQPDTDIPSSRGGSESERLHTDAADWERPVDFISMVCVRSDPAGGGRSRLLDVDALRDEVRNRLGRDILELLETEPVPWRVAAYRGGGLKWRPVLTETTVCWRRYTIDLALASNLVKLSPQLLSSLDAFEDVISTASGTVEFLMREGELLFSDNTRTIHARTPITQGVSNRLMIRSWVRAS
jgi:hypothetical protein